MILGSLWSRSYRTSPEPMPFGWQRLSRFGQCQFANVSAHCVHPSPYRWRPSTRTHHWPANPLARRKISITPKARRNRATKYFARFRCLHWSLLTWSWVVLTVTTKKNEKKSLRNFSIDFLRRFFCVSYLL